MRNTLLAVAIAALAAACATTTSPTGRRQIVGGVSQAQLNQLGEQAFADAKQKTPLSRDSKQTAYVGCVVNAIVRQLPEPWNQAKWDYALFQNDEANAWALPGGKVGIYTGIFKVARNQDQLAGVIAHEIGHVIARHHDERITRQMLASGALQVGGALAGSRYGEGIGNAVTQGGGVLAQAGFLLPNSRDQESEADVVGQQWMAKAGFDPNGAVALWQNMAAAGGARPPQWLSTHPDPASRLRELQSRADGLVPTMQAARKAGNLPRCQ
ncbi:M48 family metallopeptidase [Thermomonas sp.]|uniref:M48 family metallopeptidase n=1 Tax=Thermomonas sp. TaxID=1971895 RepID=UPI0039E2A8E3